MDAQVPRLASPSGVPHHRGQLVVDHGYYLRVAESDPWLVESADAETMDTEGRVYSQSLTLQKGETEHVKCSVRVSTVFSQK